MPTLRADLHVHSCYSRQNANLPFLKSRDCYSHPDDVYRTAKARGMHIVTITDHDTIDGCLTFLEAHPECTDFIIGEEISCRLPDGDIEVHLGIYGLTERLHRALQPLRSNVFDLTACLREAGVFFSLNHLLHFYRRQIPLPDYLRLLDEVPALEMRNGTMLPAHNELVREIANRRVNDDEKARPIGAVGGSDAHTLRRIGRTWTEAPAETAEEFLRSLQNGLGRVGGAHGSAVSVAADAYGVIGSYVASLLGRGPRDHGPARRAGCILFSLVSLPAQFLPLAIAVAAKAREAREVQRVAVEVAAGASHDNACLRPAPSEADA